MADNGSTKRPNSTEIPADTAENWFYGGSSKRNKIDPVTPSSRQPKMTAGKRDGLVEMSLGNFDTFSKQRLAIERLQESQKVFKNSRIFSYELDGAVGGERRYLVTTLDRFWIWYSKQTSRHMYELIHEDSPCRLYFDLEYSKETNKDIDHQAVFDKFFATLQSLISEEFGMDLNLSNVLILDSSSDKKYSSHVICHLKDDQLFPSSASLRSISDRLSKLLLTDISNLVWNTDGTKQTTLFDPAVYTRNRNFRLFLSAKLGSDRVLRHAEYCKFYGSRTPSEREVFFDSLCVPVNCDEAQLVDMEWFDDVVITHGPPGSAGIVHSPPVCQEGSGASPYPQLDEFILMVLRKWNSSVYLRQWKSTQVNGKYSTIVYYPSNCRYCFNIGREHKSNGTYWTVSLSELCFYQKCFDPECRGFSSNRFPLPSFIATTLKSLDSEDANSSFANPSEVESLFEQSVHEMNGFFTQWDQVFDV